MQDFHSEVFQLQHGATLLHTHCMNCSWFAAGSEQAVALAERAHICPFAGDEAPEPAESSK